MASTTPICRRLTSRAPTVVVVAALALTGGAARATPAAAPIDGVCVGDAHACALTRDGRVACWGDNGFHQVSSDDVVQLDAPRWVSPLPPARELRCGPNATCVLTAAGAIECQGFRYDDATRVYRAPGPPSPRTKIALPRPARDFVVTANGGCAILDDHTVSCWSEEDPLAPFAVPGVDDAVSFAVAAARAKIACVTRANGPPACARFAGRDPRNPLAGFPVKPMPLPDLAGGKQLLVTGETPARVCALGAPGRAAVACVTDADRPATDPLTSTTPAAFVATDGATSCVRERAAVRCVSTGDAPTVAAAVPADATAVALSPRHACAVTRGRAVCWGDASRGQLGDGTRFEHGPAPVPGIADATGVAAGHGVACAARAGGKLTCWGRASPALPFADSGFADVATPSPPIGLSIADTGLPCAQLTKRRACWDGARWAARARGDQPGAAFGRDARSLSADGACAIDRAGRLGCVVGPAAGPRRGHVVWTPGPFVEEASFASGPEGAARLACARSKDGRVACFRPSADGAKLDPATSPALAALGDVVELVAGADDALSATSSDRAPSDRAVMACARTRAGAVTCWSGGRDGAPEPRAIEGLPRATDVAVGGAFACAATSDGRVFCWGSNRDGGAPDGAPRARAAPVDVRWPPP